MLNSKNLRLELINKILFVKSYNTIVAEVCILDETIYQLGKYSKTTQRHINNVANHFNYKVVMRIELPINHFNKLINRTSFKQL
jgi:hypothetical protein